MKYKALTIVSFDRIYHKGERIPEDVIYPSMIPKLIRCRIILPIEAEKENDSLNNENALQSLLDDNKNTSNTAHGKIKKTIAKRGVKNDQDIFL